MKFLPLLLSSTVIAALTFTACDQTESTGDAPKSEPSQADKVVEDAKEKMEEVKAGVQKAAEETGAFVEKTAEATKPVIVKGAELVEDAAKAVSEKAGEVAKDLKTPPPVEPAPAPPADQPK